MIDRYIRLYQYIMNNLGISWQISWYINDPLQTWTVLSCRVDLNQGVGS